MSDTDLNRVPDGGTLRVLASGLEIVRRKKHEWSNHLTRLTPEELKRKTNKVWGSKFLAFWTLEALVDRIEREVTTARWSDSAQEPSPLDIVDVHEIGLASGESVHTIRIVCDGRYIHAYPIED
ncbi:MAG: hypothetical protein ACAI43_21235 [Phycisphaerae bacterium]|nr:hypothetical protein [Tepidisphaeraceae bacterium]